MQKSKSSGLLSRRHVLDAAEATHRLKLMRALEHELDRIQSFQQSTLQSASRALEDLLQLVKQQGADAICTFKYECESKAAAISALKSQLGKAKQPSDPQRLLPVLVAGTPLTLLMLQSVVSSFQLSRYLDFHASWTMSEVSKLHGNSREISELNIDTEEARRVGTLDLSSKAIGTEELRQLHRIADMYTSVRELNLSYSKLTEDAVPEAGKCVNRLKSLQKLVLKGNTLNGRLLRAFALNSGLCKDLISLDLEENYLGESCEDIGNSLFTCFPALKHLGLRGNALKDGDVSALCRSFPHLTSLERLDLSVNKISAGGARTLAHTLPLMNTLANLNLSENELKDDAGISLAEALPLCSKLLTLDLSYNYLTEVSVNLVVSAAVELLWLEEINVEGNRVARNSLCSAEGKIVRV